jgi:fused signal recognition particle receptor
VDDRSEDKPKAGLFRRLFGGSAPAAPPPLVAPPPAAPPASQPAVETHSQAATPAPPTTEAPPPPPAPSPATVPEPPTASEVAPAAKPAGIGRWFVLSAPAPAAAQPESERRGWLSRLTSGLSRSSSAIGRGIVDVFAKRKLDATSLDDLEDILLQADLGIGPATRLREAIGKGRYEKGIDPEEVKRLLAEEVERTLAPVARPLDIDTAKKPFVILVVGVNGSGKTTTIGKLAAKFADEGARVMLAAGDTFRAAAIEQLRIWAGRAKAEIVAREQGGDAAGLAFDALTRARAEGVDVLLMDTAGRLQNRAELMKELEKIIRVMKKVDPEAPHATLLVLDATVGQNALSQVEIFGRMAGVTGLVMTKLDGTARGGILVAIADKHKLPVHFIGVGEQMDDLEPFEARDFARAIAGVE